MSVEVNGYMFVVNLLLTQLSCFDVVLGVEYLSTNQ